MLTTLARIDGFIQKQVVDRSAFFLFRTGYVNKTFLKYAVMATAAAALLVHDVMKNGGMTGLDLISTAAFLFGMQNIFAKDGAEESSRTAVSSMDAEFLSLSGFGKSACVLAYFLDSASLMNGPTPEGMYAVTLPVLRTMLAAHVIGNTCFLYYWYLVRTPKTPPPTEEKRSFLVPAYARASR